MKKIYNYRDLVGHVIDPLNRPLKRDMPTKQRFSGFGLLEHCVSYPRVARFSGMETSYSNDFKWKMNTDYMKSNVIRRCAYFYRFGK